MNRCLRAASWLLALVLGAELANAQRQDSTARGLTLPAVLIKKQQASSTLLSLPEEQGGALYSGRKTELITLDSLNFNAAQNSLRQALGKVPGLTLTETEGQGFPSSGIAFRGLNPSQSIEMNVRQNGYNIAADLYGYPETYYLPPLEAVERIELVRGAAGLQWGPQFGGLINYVTRSATTAPLELTLQQTGGSYGLYNSFASLGGTRGRCSIYAYGQYKGLQGWRPNSDLRQVSAFTRLEYKPSQRFTVGLEYSLLRNRIHMPGGLTDAEFSANAKQSFRARNWLQTPWNIATFTASWQVSGGSVLSLKSAFMASARNLVWRNEEGGPGAPDSIAPTTLQYVPREVERETFTSSSTEVRLLTHYPLLDNTSTLATGIRAFWGKLRRLGGGPGSTGSDFDLNLYGGTYGYSLQFGTTNLAAFVENTVRLSQRLSLTPGLRYEFIRSTAQGYITDDETGQLLPTSLGRIRSFVLGGLGLQFITSSSTQLYGSIQQAYRPIDYSSLTPIGVASVIDPHLQDSRGSTAEVGWRGRLGSKLAWDLSAFSMLYGNRIGLVTLQDAAGKPYTYRTNVATSVHQGIEAYLELRNWLQGRWGTISLYESFAAIDARYTTGDFKGKQVEYAPKTISRLGLSYQRGALRATCQWSATAPTYGDANNTLQSTDAVVGQLPAYQTWDLSASYKFGQGQRFWLKGSLNNLADASYFTRRTDEYPGPGILPAVGRNFAVTIGGRFN